MLTTAAGVLIMPKARGENPIVMVGAVMLGLLVVSLPGSLAVGRLPSAADVGLAALAGLIMGSGNFVMLAAIHRAPAALIAPTQYTMLVWALLYGVALFGNPIRANIVAGAALVIGASLFILHRERVRGGGSRIGGEAAAPPEPTPPRPLGGSSP
jgi:drug/metabolite transporter (DMT)-like permease